jgi:hypothetical protein
MHEAEIQVLKNEISEHKIRIFELEQLNTLLESDQIVTFENGKYSNEIRECIVFLISTHLLSPLMNLNSQLFSHIFLAFHFRFSISCSYSLTCSCNTFNTSFRKHPNSTP